MSNVELKGLSEAASFQTAQASLPPVHTWSPPFCGDMDLVIKANGEWFHEGGKIKRSAMVAMFSRILWFEAGEYFLVTPVEKVRIQVEDAPFLVTEWRWIETEYGQAIEFKTHTDDVLILGVDCDLWMDFFKGEERPYISMRYGMKALVRRNAFYGLAESLERVETSKGTGMGVISAGKSYLLMEDE
ncbi:hypothetical protein MUS1_15575 [Marinomonas ushuaiensis DSM 15871]|uniref:Proteophosphoglycan n=1 Tax=Marinomonas ushuaiensis DSM 15871 TaxID=1122207 RepID=X7E2N3_9GAMM|nr:DUF1285 domain-containing protein [Marinomonas ushuaiensis]ETX10334.1 hypothetical protein MUS1_15575 [Marinomonas ushuaiensis DSM 15871]